MGFFPDAQGQLIPQSLVLWLLLLPARIMKNQTKMKELEWSQDFPH